MKDQTDSPEALRQPVSQVPSEYEAPEAQEKLLVLVSNTSDHEYLIRAGQRIAHRRTMPWTVVWVDTGRIADQQALLRLQAAFSLAKELGAATDTLRGPSTYQTIVPFIAGHGFTTVLVGSGPSHRLRPWRKRLYRKLVESGLTVEIGVIPSPRTKMSALPLLSSAGGFSLGKLAGHAFAVLAVALANAVAVPLELVLTNANLVLLYVLAVVATALKHGGRAALTASLLAFLSFNFFLTEPRYTLHVTRQDEVATLFFLLLIALACSPAVSLIRRQFVLLQNANRHSEAMRVLGQALSVAEDEKAVWQAMHNVIADTLSVECIIVPFDVTAKNNASDCRSRTTPLTPADEAALDWARRHRKTAGRFSDTPGTYALGTSEWTVIPVNKDELCVACVMLKFPPTTKALTPGDKALLNAVIQQGADTWRRTQLVAELESARVKTEVEQLRSALLSSVSHDLKSPLSAMMGSAESLRLLDQQLSAEDRDELVDTILLESRRLDSYIQNLLDMTRLGHGSLKIERDWVSMGDIIGSALSRLKRYFANAKVEFHAFTEPPLMYVHAALLEQALFNILENATRFSPPTEPVQVTLDRHNNTCVISIEDRGPGIPQDQREQIFDMFYVVAEGDQKKQNTGMGLAICRGMVGAHGGTVSVTSGTGNIGTRFTVELPIAPPDNAGDGTE